MIRSIGMHGANETQIVHMRRGLLKQFTYLNTALSPGFEFERRGQGGTGRSFGCQVSIGDHFACIFFQ